MKLHKTNVFPPSPETSPQESLGLVLHSAKTAFLGGFYLKPAADLDVGSFLNKPMTLPPLPLIDGYMFVDNSFIETMSTCMRAAQYSRLQRKRARGAKAALNFGTAWHCAMEARYRAEDLYIDGTTEQAMYNAVETHFTSVPQPEDDYRNLDMAVSLIRFYNNLYKTEQFEICKMADGKPCVELPFALPLKDESSQDVVFYYRTAQGEQASIKVMYTGKIDLLIKQYNQIYTLDHKTSSMFGTTFWQEQQMSGQHVGYCACADEILGIETAGYIVSAVRTGKPPVKKAWPSNDDFGRNTYYLTKERKLEWRANLISLIQGFLDAYSHGTLPMSPKWCVGKYGVCQFFDVCSLPLSQRDAALESGLYEDDTWTPLKMLENKTQKENL